MLKCLGKHSCISSPFSIAILNGTCCLRSPGIDYVLVLVCYSTKHFDNNNFNDFLSFSVLVYVNHECSVGPYLGSVRELPVRFGPGSLNRVLREAVQALVDCAASPPTVAAMLPSGTGKVIIQGQPCCPLEPARSGRFSQCYQYYF